MHRGYASENTVSIPCMLTVTDKDSVLTSPVPVVRKIG